jgi:hypothetical protein
VKQEIEDFKLEAERAEAIAIMSKKVKKFVTEK